MPPLPPPPGRDIELPPTDPNVSPMRFEDSTQVEAPMPPTEVPIPRPPIQLSPNPMGVTSPRQAEERNPTPPPSAMAFSGDAESERGRDNSLPRQNLASRNPVGNMGEPQTPGMPPMNYAKMGPGPDLTKDINLPGGVHTVGNSNLPSDQLMPEAENRPATLVPPTRTFPPNNVGMQSPVSSIRKPLAPPPPMDNTADGSYINENPPPPGYGKLDVAPNGDNAPINPMSSIRARNVFGKPQNTPWQNVDFGAGGSSKVNVGSGAPPKMMGPRDTSNSTTSVVTEDEAPASSRYRKFLETPPDRNDPAFKHTKMDKFKAGIGAVLTASPEGAYAALDSKYNRAMKDYETKAGVYKAGAIEEETELKRKEEDRKIKLTEKKEDDKLAKDASDEKVLKDYQDAILADPNASEEEKKFIRIRQADPKGTIPEGLVGGGNVTRANYDLQKGSPVNESGPINATVNKQGKVIYKGKDVSDFVKPYARPRTEANGTFSQAPIFDDKGRQTGVTGYNNKTNTYETPHGEIPKNTRVPVGAAQLAVKDKSKSDARKTLSKLETDITEADKAGVIGPAGGRISDIEQHIGNPDPKLSKMVTRFIAAKMQVDAGIGGIRAAASPQLLARWDAVSNQNLTADNLRSAVEVFKDLVAADDADNPPANTRMSATGPGGAKMYSDDGGKSWHK